MHNSVHMANVTWNFTFQSTAWEHAKLKCSEISTLQDHQIKMQLKYSVLQFYSGVLRRQPHRRSGLATLPSLGADP